MNSLKGSKTSHNVKDGEVRSKGTSPVYYRPESAALLSESILFDSLGLKIILSEKVSQLFFIWEVKIW